MAQVKGTTTSSSSSTKKKTTTSVASAVKTGATAGASASNKKTSSSSGSTSAVKNAVTTGALAGIVTPTASTSSYSSPSSSSSSYSSPSSSSSSSSSYSVPSFSYSPYTESQAVIDARNAMNAHNSTKVGDWTGGTYGEALKAAMDKILNRDSFSFDLGDTAYDYYKNMYMLNGNMAMQDTMGQAAAMTGGYGSSYATTAGAQAYQGYLQQLNNVIPELWQMAYDKYSDEGQELYNQYGMINNAYGTEYGEWQDKVDNWNTEADRLANAYYNLADMDFTRYKYDRSSAESAYAQQIAALQAQVDAQQKQEYNAASTAARVGALAGLVNINPTGYTNGQVVEYLATKATDGNGKVLTDAQKIDALIDAGVSSAEIAAARKYIAKDKQVANRL